MQLKDDPPPAALRGFEQILFVLCVLMLLAGLAFLCQREWLFGALTVVIAFFVAVVGQSLPHHKKESLEQLYTNKGDISFRGMTSQECRGVGNALLHTTLLVSIFVGAAALNRGARWYWAILDSACSWFLFPLLSILYCVLYSVAMEKMRTTAQCRKVSDT